MQYIEHVPCATSKPAYDRVIERRRAVALAMPISVKRRRSRSSISPSRCGLSSIGGAAALGGRSDTDESALSGAHLTVIVSTETGAAPDPGNAEPTPLNCTTLTL